MAGATKATSRSMRRAKLRSKNAKQGWCNKKTIALFALFMFVVFVFNISHLIMWYNHEVRSDILAIGNKETALSVQPVQGNVVASHPKGKEPLVIAHVVSLIKCKKHTTGFLDAAAVLRHSIHKQSYHESKSAYSYQMYAIVHPDCKEHAPLLNRLGYKTLVKESPVLLDDIKPGWYRDHVESENCCGSKEFIKLYAYSLTDHLISVHWDLDVAILQPLDDLFDAMIYDKSSEQGSRARANLELQHPQVPLPDKIDAFFTRDVTSSVPYEKAQVVQGGFLVARTDPSALETYVTFIKEANYVGGRGPGKGWAGLGYGGFQGAMAYQGVLAYFYDAVRPKTAVELNICRYNQVVADVIWRGPHKMEHHMQCRDYPLDGNFKENTQCEDCRVTPIELTKTAHYTACKKPWECHVPHPRHSKVRTYIRCVPACLLCSNAARIVLAKCINILFFFHFGFYLGTSEISIKSLDKHYNLHDSIS